MYVCNDDDDYVDNEGDDNAGDGDDDVNTTFVTLSSSSIVPNKTSDHADV